ncbi:MAG: hypothetical protein JSS57_00525 [Proteobacteria bacterium]|nr:hypothetical protein [Pseudomonadota bacterium]
MSFKYLVLKKLEKIMSLIDDLKAAQAASDAKITELQAAVETSNGKTDALILVANATKDALVALQGTIANGQVVTSADLQGVIDGINAGTAKAQAAVDSLAAQNTETDAAAAADAP